MLKLSFHHRRFVVLAALLVAASCATGVVEIGDWHGVGYRFETGNSLRVSDAGEDLHVAASGYTLEVVGGRVNLNGVDHGLVRKGDHVVVTKKGRLFVNRTKRLPVNQD